MLSTNMWKNFWTKSRNTVGTVWSWRIFIGFFLFWWCLLILQLFLLITGFTATKFTGFTRTFRSKWSYTFPRFTGWTMFQSWWTFTIGKWRMFLRSTTRWFRSTLLWFETFWMTKIDETTDTDQHDDGDCNTNVHWIFITIMIGSNCWT